MSVFVDGVASTAERTSAVVIVPSCLLARLATSRDIMTSASFRTLRTGSTVCPSTGTGASCAVTRKTFPDAR